MNKNKLRQMCHDRALQFNLPFNSVFTCYFLEHILRKVANSKYSGNLLFKGGFLLSNIIGASNRTTKDMDFSLTKATLTEENVLSIFNEILDSTDEEIKTSVEKIEPIREEDEYGGFRLTILCRFENIRVMLPVDIATGDVVTPAPLEYSYKSMFGEPFILKSYTVQTIVAEKLQTLYKRGLFNSRCKDFYDLYILYKVKKDSLDRELLLEACKNTFEYRETELSFDAISELLTALKRDSSFAVRWKAYAKRNVYATELTLTDVVENICNLVDWLK